MCMYFLIQASHPLFSLQKNWYNYLPNSLIRRNKATPDRLLVDNLVVHSNQDLISYWPLADAKFPIFLSTLAVDSALLACVTALAVAALPVPPEISLAIDAI